MDPFFVSVTAALVGKAVGSLYETVRKRLQGDTTATQELERVTSGQATESELEGFARLLQETATSDGQFKADLEVEFGRQVAGSSAGDDAVSNVIGGNVSGKVVQARDIDGGVRF